VIHKVFRFYIRLMRFLGVLTYDVSGLEKLKDARLILANHPSLIDVVFLIAMVPNANCVVKGRLARNPVMRGPINGAGYIVNDTAEDVVDAAKSVFDKGHALIVFPEGTRTTPDEDIILKRGAANIAVRAQSDITPVLIGCTPTTLTKQDKWYQVPSRRVHFWMKVQDQIEIAPYLDERNPSVAARSLTQYLTGYFSKELSKHE
jgi:1-acyl-sn-glycerol-3-phosphate acyltransferase